MIVASCVIGYCHYFYFLLYRVSDIMKEAVSSITLKDIVKRYKGPSTHMHSSKIAVDKITQGKIKGAVEV